MKKQRMKKLLTAMTSYMLVTALVVPSVTPMVSYGAEYVRNRPRYVDFSRPEALTLGDLGLENLGLGNDDVTDGSGTGGQEPETTVAETAEASSEENSAGGGAGDNGSAEEPGQETSTDPTGESGGTEESSPMEESGSTEESSTAEETGSTDGSSPAEESGTTDGSSSAEETGNTEESSSDGESGTTEEGQTGGSTEGLPGELPAATPSDADREVPAATPSDAQRELREPEPWHETVIDEPEGELVRFTDSYRIYQTGEREYVTVIGGYSGLYLTEEGEVGYIDNSLVETGGDQEGIPEAASYGRRAAARVPAYRNAAGRTRITIPEELSADNGITMEHDGYAIGMAPSAGSFDKGVVADNAIRYNDVFENVDYQYTIAGNSLKEDIILLERQERNRFSSRLRTPGLTASLEGGVIQVREEGGEDPLFTLEAPFMEDSAGVRSHEVSLSIEGSGGSYTVMVEADREWLEAEERQYPVRIDPTPLVPSDEFIFATVSENKPGTHYDWDLPAYVGYVDDARGNTRIYVAINALNNEQFNSAMSGVADCTRATFEVTAQTDNSQGSTVIQLCKPTAAWDAGRITWNTKPDHSKAEADIIDGNAPGAGKKIEYDITSIVKAWNLDPSTHFGFMMKAEFEPWKPEEMPLKMPAEILCNRTDAQNGPKIRIEWEGELPGGLEGVGIDDTTVEVHPSVMGTDANGRSVTGILAHGLAQPQSKVYYSLKSGGTEEDGGNADAEGSLAYPDFEAASLEDGFSIYAGSNWQGRGYTVEELDLDRIYRFEAHAEGKPLDEEGNVDEEAEEAIGKTAESDEFLLYEVKLDDLAKNIARHYGVNPNQVAKDNRLYRNQLTEAGTILFIRSPERKEPYRQGTLSDLDRMLIMSLKAGTDINCVMGHEPINLNTGAFYMSHVDAELPELDGTFTIDRNYNSTLPEYRMEFGMGWSSPFGEHLTVLPDGSCSRGTTARAWPSSARETSTAPRQAMTASWSPWIPWRSHPCSQLQIRKLKLLIMPRTASRMRPRRPLPCSWRTRVQIRQKTEKKEKEEEKERKRKKRSRNSRAWQDGS